MTLTKKDSDMLKGIAIIMMLIHHFWNPVMQPIPRQFQLGDFIVPNIEILIAETSKICVSIFAFLTGYVLWLNRNKYSSYSYIYGKLRSFLLNYWFVGFVFILLAIAFAIKLPSLKIFIANLFGFEVGAYEILGYDYVNVVHAWYVRFYICLLLTFPIILRLLDRTDRFNHFVTFCIYIVICECAYLCFRNSDVYILKKMVAIYFQWIPAVLFGYYACRYGWLAKMEMMDIKKSVIILFVLLIQRLIFPYFFMLDFLSVLPIATVAIKITPRCKKYVSLVRTVKYDYLVRPWGVFFI